MAVFERLLHRRTMLTAPAIDKTAAEPAAGATADPASDDVTGYALVQPEGDPAAATPGHWEPECGTPVHSKRHLVR